MGVRSGFLVATLLGSFAYVSCSSGTRNGNEDGSTEAGAGAGAITGIGGSSGNGRGGNAGRGGSSTGEAGDATMGGEDSGGNGATGAASGTGGATGGSATGGNAGTSGTSGAGAAGGGGDGGSGGMTIPPCGNGRLDAGETCDDGGTAPNDGCSATCTIESGFDCPGEPSVCHPTTCGNGTVEGGEACDDANALPFDGCTSDCRREPSCTPGMPCTSPCGDGIVLGSEECDDGNRRNGDGCSSTCTVESGFDCESAPPCQMRNGSCTTSVPIVFRDFNASTAAGGHPDFQPGFNSAGATMGLVQPMLDTAGKPVLSATASVANGYMHGASAFAQWFRNGAPASAPIPQLLVLWDNGSGGFVNRWGANGERWVAYQNSMFCSNVDCNACGAPPEGTVCRSPCPGLGTYACFVSAVQYDGNPLFFPIDSAVGILTEPRTAAKVPEQYGWMGWPAEATVATTLGVTTPIPTSASPFPTATHNFSFTSEVRFWFRYDATVTQRVAFTGDDDAWVFVNGKLAVDLGGWHVPLSGSATIDANTYSLTNGSLYEVDVFHAEREIEGSSYRLELTGMSPTISRCTRR